MGHSGRGSVSLARSQPEWGKTAALENGFRFRRRDQPAVQAVASHGTQPVKLRAGIGDAGRRESDRQRLGLVRAVQPAGEQERCDPVIDEGAPRGNSRRIR